MPRSLWVAFALATIPSASAQSDPPRTQVSHPRTPDIEQRTFKLDPGLAIELVASEPQIESPVAIAFDENERLWVVEMRDYPNGPKPGEKPAGRIKALFDEDHDGFYERANIFADDLLFANGLLPWDGGLIVTSAPHILYLKDEDGDGKADKREVLWEGFAVENPQLRVSHPILGLDGWVYVVNGLRGGKVKRPGDASSAAIDISGRDFKFNPLTGKGEAIAGMGQYGNTFDDWGRRFVCTNRNHLIPILFEEKYARRNPTLIPPPPISDNQNAGGAAQIFPISKNFTTSTLHEGSFSASCGVFIYRGDLLGPSYYGCAFTCDPTGNLVHQEVLEPDGAGFKWHPPRQGVEFLASTDDWFRPVFLTDGPDGALYVVDMYRAVIEHPEWMPPELQNRPDLELGRDKGRIWRVAPTQPGPRGDRPRLANATPTELIALLGHPNGWYRRNAQRLLLPRMNPQTHALLSDALNATPPIDERVRVHAAWLLHSTGQPSGEIALRLAANAHNPATKENVLRLLEPAIAGSEQALELALQLANDADPRVRFQAALALGEWTPAEPQARDTKAAALAAILARSPQDIWTRTAVLSAADDVRGALLKSLGAREDLRAWENPGVSETWKAAVVQAGAANDVLPIRDTLSLLAETDDSQTGRQKRIALLTALSAGLSLKGLDLQHLSNSLTQSKDPEDQPSAVLLTNALQSLPGLATDDRLPTPDRIDAVRLLKQANRDEAHRTLEALISKETQEPALQIAAVESLGALASDFATVTWLVAIHQECSPSVQRAIVRALLATPGGVDAILSGIEAGTLADADLDATQVKHLLATVDESQRKRALQLLAARIPADRTEVLARYQPALQSPGTPARGRSVFLAQCAQCHRLEGQGVAVGPDLSDLRTKSPEMLLNDILNPNAAIDANYQAFTIATRDGRILSGIIAAESAAGLTLKRAQGESDNVLRGDVEAIRPTGQSLMPEGVEKDIPIQAMADLIAYLKYWRYEQAGIPIPGTP